MTSKAHHVQEATAVSAKDCAYLSSSFVSFLKVYQDHVEPVIKEL